MMVDGLAEVLKRFDLSKEEVDGVDLDPGLLVLWNLPYCWFNKEVGKKIEEVFRAVREVVIPEGGRKEGRHMKILAEVEVKKPLLRRTMVKSNGISK
ncbi:hypothetical protein ACH5RR_012352 [Cinchona calisaya]|uniref:Uncharacterized protein n=1 Tax=Cinchona calisaya TaxID=153742 RepID=A0ABD3A7F7_9GENT